MTKMIGISTDGESVGIGKMGGLWKLALKDGN